MSKPHNHLVILGLGANLGDRVNNLCKATNLLSNFSTIQRSSRIYETEPWGYADQPKFLNQVVIIKTILEPLELLQRLKYIERQMGRTAGPRYGPRPIDLDILFYDDLVLERPELTIPHPMISERAFLLVPLAEINPELIHPKLHCTITALLQKVDKQGVTIFQG